MRRPDKTIEVFEPGTTWRVHLTPLPTAFAFFKEKGTKEIPTQCKNVARNDGDTHALRSLYLVCTGIDPVTTRGSAQVGAIEGKVLDCFKQQGTPSVWATRRTPNAATA